MADAPKSFHLSPEVHDYLVRHGTPPDALLQELVEETRKLGPISMMQIAPEQGAFMTLLARAIGARRAIEVGTFTGYSAISIARGLPDDGRLLCCDVSGEWSAVARRFFEKAGLAHKIELRLAPGIETLRALPATQDVDLAFIDADKPSYPLYYEEILKRLRPGGLLLADNVLWFGRVADPAADDDQTRAIRRFNDLVAADERVDRVMLPIADGLTIARKR
jgi:caffeoyl-CoA O-methyltransferase